MKTRAKRTICRILGLALFLLMLDIVGGMEWGDIPVLRGGVLSALCELTGAVLLYKAGVVRV